MSFHVRNPTTDRLVRELARRRKVGLTEAIDIAVSNELKRDKIPLRIQLREIAEEIARCPKTGLKADKKFFDEMSGD